jgi:hypothetical protein
MNGFQLKVVGIFFDHIVLWAKLVDMYVSIHTKSAYFPFVFQPARWKMPHKKTVIPNSRPTFDIYLPLSSDEE